MLYKYIKNPKNGQLENILSQNGKLILQNYINQLGGHNGPCEFNNSTGRCKKGKVADKRCELSKGRCILNKSNSSKLLSESLPLQIQESQKKKKRRPRKKKSKPLSESLPLQIPESQKNKKKKPRKKKSKQQSSNTITDFPSHSPPSYSSLTKDWKTPILDAAWPLRAMYYLQTKCNGLCCKYIEDFLNNEIDLPIDLKLDLFNNIGTCDISQYFKPKILLNNFENDYYTIYLLPKKLRQDKAFLIQAFLRSGIGIFNALEEFEFNSKYNRPNDSAALKVAIIPGLLLSDRMLKEPALYLAAIYGSMMLMPNKMDRKRGYNNAKEIFYQARINSGQEIYEPEFGVKSKDKYKKLIENDIDDDNFQNHENILLYINKYLSHFHIDKKLVLLALKELGTPDNPTPNYRADFNKKIHIKLEVDGLFGAAAYGERYSDPLEVTEWIQSL